MSSAPVGITTRGLAAMALLVVLATAGCGSSGGSPAASKGSATHPQSSQPPATSRPRGKTAPPLRAADVQQIKHAYETFFDGKTPVSASEKLLQNGSKLKATLAAQAKTQEAKALTAKVTKVSRAPGNPNQNVAQVMFTLAVSGQNVPLPGYAVLDHGTWKVSAGTFCQLLQLQQSAPKKCSQAAITAFPTG